MRIKKFIALSVLLCCLGVLFANCGAKTKCDSIMGSTCATAGSQNSGETATILTYSLLSNDGKTYIPGQIVGKNITVTMPFNTIDQTHLVANFTLNKGTSISVNGVPQISASTPNDFTHSQTNPVPYVAKSDDGSSISTYLVTVKLAPSSDTTLSDFSLPGMQSATVSPLPCTSCTINITMPYGATNFLLSPRFQALGKKVTKKSDGTVVQGNGLDSPIDFSKPVTLVVTAADATTTATYTIVVTCAQNPDTTLNNFSLQGMTSSTPSQTPCTACTIAVIMPYNTTDLKLVTTFQSTGKVTLADGSKISSGDTVDYTNSVKAPVILTVTAPNGNQATYAVSVTIAQNPSSDTTLNNFSLQGMTSSTPSPTPCTACTITVIMPYGTTNLNLVTNFQAVGKVTRGDGSKVNSGDTVDYTNAAITPVVLTVTAPNGNKATYAVSVTVNSSQISTNIYINGKQVTNMEIQQGAVVPFTINFKTDVGKITNLKLASTDNNFTISTSNCAAVDSTGTSCQINVTYVATKVLSTTTLPIYFTYTGNLNHNPIINFTYKVDLDNVYSINTTHGSVNTLTLSSPAQLLANSDRGVVDTAALPSTFLTKLIFTEGSGFSSPSDYPTTDVGYTSVSYSNPWIDTNHNNDIVQKRIESVLYNASNVFSFGLYVNDTLPKAFMLYGEPNPNLDPAYLSGFKTAPISTHNNDNTYYVTSVNRYGTDGTLYPYISKIDPSIGNMSAAPNWFKKLDAISDNTSTALEPRPPILMGNNLYFKSNYPCSANNPGDNSEVYILDTSKIDPNIADQTNTNMITSKLSLTSSKSNLLVTKNGKYVFIGNDKGSINVYDLTLSPITTLDTGDHTLVIENLILNNNEDTIYALTDAGIFSFNVSDLSGGKIIPKIFKFSNNKKSSTYDMVLNSSNSILYVANGMSIYALSATDLSQLWNSSSWSQMAGNNITAVVLSNPDGRVYVGTDGGSVYSLSTVLPNSSNFYTLN